MSKRKSLDGTKVDTIASSALLLSHDACVDSGDTALKTTTLDYYMHDIFKIDLNKTVKFSIRKF